MREVRGRELSFPLFLLLRLLIKRDICQVYRLGGGIGGPPLLLDISQQYTALCTMHFISNFFFFVPVDCNRMNAARRITKCSFSYAFLFFPECQRGQREKKKSCFHPAPQTSLSTRKTCTPNPPFYFPFSAKEIASCPPPCVSRGGQNYRTKIRFFRFFGEEARFFKESFLRSVVPPTCDSSSLDRETAASSLVRESPRISRITS